MSGRFYTLLRDYKGLWFLAGGTLGTAMIPIFAQIVLRTVPETHFTFLWMGSATVWAALWMVGKGPTRMARLARRRWFSLVLTGVFALGGAYFYFRAVARLDAALVAFLNNSRIVWGVAIGAVLFHERVSTVQALYIALAILGVALVFVGTTTFDGTDGMIDILLATVLFLLVNAVIKRRIPGEAVPLALFARFFVPALALGLVVLIRGDSLAYLSMRHLVALAVGGFIGPFLSFLLLFMAVPLVPFNVQAVFRSLGVVFTALASYTVFGTTPSVNQYIGGTIILVAVLLLAFHRDRRGRGDGTNTTTSQEAL